MDAERIRLLKQVLDQRVVIGLLVTGPLAEATVEAPGPLNSLNVAELQTVAAALAILSDAARRQGDTPQPARPHPDA
jgi:hypothetical protein